MDPVLALTILNPKLTFTDTETDQCIADGICVQRGDGSPLDVYDLKRLQVSHGFGECNVDAERLLCLAVLLKQPDRSSSGSRFGAMSGTDVLFGEVAGGVVVWTGSDFALSRAADARHQSHRESHGSSTEPSLGTVQQSCAFFSLSIFTHSLKA